MVSTEEVHRLIEYENPLLINVLALPRQPEDLPKETLWLPKAHYHLPGSVWLSNTGFGDLPVEEEEYLRFHLERLSNHDPSHPMVFYCLRNCWLSWNAARRAVAWNYTSVIWYPEGIDGWKEAGLPLVKGLPVARDTGH